MRAVLRAAHPGPTLAVTVASGLLAVAAGLDAAWVALVVAAVLTGQLSIGWSNDLVDLARDRTAHRVDKPLANGEASPALVRGLCVAAVVLCVPLSLACGLVAGAVHLVCVAAGWAYNLGLKSTAWSWAPYAVAFGGLPVFVGLVDGGAGFAWWVPVVGALLGVGAHLVNVVPDLDDDAATGVRGLPHRLGARVSVLLACALLASGSVVVVLGRRARPRARGGGPGRRRRAGRRGGHLRRAHRLPRRDGDRAGRRAPAGGGAPVTDGEDWDLVVVGAGPAGACAALGALRPTRAAGAAARPRRLPARQGLRRRHRTPRLRRARGGRRHDAADGWEPLHRLALTRGDLGVERPMRRPVWVIPREVFDARLVDAAVAAGAVLRRHRVREVEAGPDGVVLDGTLRAPVVVGADGVHSVCRSGRRACPVPDDARSPCAATPRPRRTGAARR